MDEAEKYTNVVAVTRDGRPRAPVVLEDRPVDGAALYQVAVDMFAKLRPRNERKQALVVPRAEVPRDLFTVDDATRKDGADGIPKFEIRLRKIRDLESGLIRASLSPVELVERWKVALDNIMVGLRSEQERADWRIAAVVAKPSSTSKTRVDRGTGKPLGGSRVSVQAMAGLYNGFEEWQGEKWAPPPAGVGSVSSVTFDDPYIEIALVMYDAAQVELVDPNRRLQADRDTPIAQYVKTRRLDQMPTGLYAERVEAAELWALIERAERERPVPVVKARASDEDIAAMVASGLPLARVSELLAVPLDEVKAAALRASATKGSSKKGKDAEAP
jgi:hypothetical protein